MPTQTGRFVDELVRRYLHPPLKVCGFRRRVRTWNRAAADLVHVVQLQASAWNMGESGSFTVNLGVSIPSADPLCWGRPAPGFVSEVECIVRLRAGLLGEGGVLLGRHDRRDQWWDFDAGTRMDQLGREVAGTIAMRVVPFLDRFDSIRSVSDFLTQHEDLTWEGPRTRLYMAALLAQLGERDRAQRILLDEIDLSRRFSTDSEWAEAARQMAGRIGIALGEDG